jgi:hypothetical protein
MFFKEMSEWALGPSGVLMLNWYFENSLLINGIIVAGGIWAALKRRNKA